jgi:hypothetical protein
VSAASSGSSQEAEVASRSQGVRRDWDGEVLRRILGGLNLPVSSQDAAAVVKLVEPLRKACDELVAGTQHDAAGTT